MRQFLNKCNPKTLFLIDEFGTGSDPELGGALAEAFLEEFNERQAMGLITTHYANLKLLANELPNLVNANMQFDEQTLEPRYKLIIGQAGSSFTFEVAQKNGIPFSLINKAKKKIESGKIRFDKTIVKLQKEREKMEKISKSLETEQQKKSKESDKMAETNAKIQKKLESYQELYDYNQRLIHLGQKISQIGERYSKHKLKKQLMSEIMQLVETENAKKKSSQAAKSLDQKKPIAEISKEVQDKIKTIRESKQKQGKKVVEKPKPVLHIGDEVRLFDGKAVGTIASVEKGKALINYGAFTTKVSLEQLELVKPFKR
jgi:DNA mismatch repair protein MutS2